MSALPILVAIVFATSCTTRKDMSPVRTNYSINLGDDSDKIRKKYAESGWKLDEDGEIVPTREKNENMFRGDEFHGGEKAFDGKKSRLSKKKVDSKSLEMPEYLNRQKDFDTKGSKDSGKKARENVFDKFRLKDSDVVAKTKNKSWLEKLGLFNTKSARDSGKKFKASENKGLAKATGKTVDPNPRRVAPGGGFYRDSDMSMDEVKELVSPDGIFR